MKIPENLNILSIFYVYFMHVCAHSNQTCHPVFGAVLRGSGTWIVSVSGVRTSHGSGDVSTVLPEKPLSKCQIKI